jgi:hypothetical protein
LTAAVSMSLATIDLMPGTSFQYRIERRPRRAHARRVAHARIAVRTSAIAKSLHTHARVRHC